MKFLTNTILIFYCNSLKSLLLNSLFCLKIFFNVYLFLREEERQSMSGEGAERERERETQNPKQAPGSGLRAVSPRQSSNSQTVRS